MALLMAQFMLFNLVKSHLSSINLLEEDLLSMILHWEVAADKTVTEPELLGLKKLCKDKKLFLNLGFGPFIEQESSINEWLTQAKDEEIFRHFVQEKAKSFKGTPKQKLKAMHFLIQTKADIVHVLILKVIQLLDKISGDPEMLQKFDSGKFDDINQQIETIVNEEPAVKKMFNKLEASKNLEEDITNMIWKISDKSSSEMFQVNSCAKCGYMFDPNIEMGKCEGKKLQLSVCLSVCLSIHLFL
jgi:hypothetical protein